MKKKILVVGDSAAVHSGFGKCIREIFSRLYKEFEIVQLGWFNKNPTEKVPFKIFPTLMKDGEILQSDKNGEISFDKMLKSFQPDIVWTNGDPWMVAHIARSRDLYSSFYWFAQTYIEAGPVFDEHKEVWNRADEIIPVTQYGKEIISRVNGINRNKIKNPITNGVDCNLFKPHSEQNFRNLVLNNNKLRRTNKKPFIIGYNGRNHTRKMVANLYITASMLLSNTYRHCHKCNTVVAPIRHWEEMRWEVPSICPVCRGTELNENADNIEFVFWFHIPQGDRGYRLKELEKQFNIVDRIGMSTEYKVLKGIPEKELPSYYQSLDLFLTFADEGFGLCALESMACGVPVVSPAHSASYEVTKELDLNWKPSGWWIQETLHIPRPMPDYNSVLTNIFKVVYNKKLYKNRALDIVKKHNWDDIAKQWKHKFNNISKLNNGTVLI